MITSEKSKRKKKAPPKAEQHMTLSPEQFALLQEIYEQNKAIKKRLAWSVTANWARLIIILIPIILAVIYVPAIIQGVVEEYQSILQVLPTSPLGGIDFTNFDFQGLLENYSGKGGQR